MRESKEGIEVKGNNDITHKKASIGEEMCGALYLFFLAVRNSI